MGCFAAGAGANQSGVGKPINPWKKGWAVGGCLWALGRGARRGCQMEASLSSAASAWSVSIGVSMAVAAVPITIEVVATFVTVSALVASGMIPAVDSVKWRDDAAAQDGDG